MKYRALTVAACIMIVTATSCTNELTTVPSVVNNALQSGYPDAMNVSWEKAGKDYEAEFTRGQKELTVLINDQGQVLKHKEEADKEAGAQP
ncbi:MAG: hypothetical protein EOP49_06095 [Sphingobacteriales bacterium]|nr:MAG: hypothetical protein EOP49_06095 [Sphingobacteriales bacterium]